MDHAVRLANVHDVGNTDDVSRTQPVLVIAREALIKLQEHLRVTRSPRVDLANVRVTARRSSDVVCTVNEAWHALVEACSEGSMQVVNRMRQMRAISERRLRSMALAAP